MKKDIVFIGGAHRGGRAVTDAALRTLPFPKIFDRIIIADPKEDRALRLAERWSDEGISSTGIKKPCEEVINEIEADKVLLAIDDISPMAQILQEKNLPTQWQLLVRGLGHNGPVIGLSGTIVKGDSANRRSSARLINVLSSFIEPQSSSSIRQNPLNADALYMVRKKVSEHSVRRLQVLDRDPKDLNGGALNLIWGMKAYPMTVQEKPESENWKETKQQALETETDYSNFAVASLGQGNVDFFVVEQIKERRVIRFHLPLMHVLPPDVNSGLGLLAGTETSVPAVVTD